MGNVAARREPDWLWRTTIGELIGQQKIDGLLRAESLAEDLAAAGLQAGLLVRHNASYRRDWQVYYTSELREALQPWATPDCERFGYDLSGRPMGGVEHRTHAQVERLLGRGQPDGFFALAGAFALEVEVEGTALDLIERHVATDGKRFRGLPTCKPSLS